MSQWGSHARAAKNHSDRGDAPTMEELRELARFRFLQSISLGVQTKDGRFVSWDEAFADGGRDGQMQEVRKTGGDRTD